MSIYDNNKELLSTLGVEGNYSTDFEVRKAILNALGGDASICNSIYEVDLQILKIYQEGGGGSAQKPVFKIKDGNVFRTEETEIPFDIDSTGVTDFGWMFESCGDLITIPHLDTSKGTRFQGMFKYCTNLTSVPQLETSNGTLFGEMFKDCTNLTSVPRLSTSNGTYFGSMFYGCTNLTEIPQIDTSNGTGFSYMFNGCRNLVNIKLTNTSNGDNFSNMFNGCKNLEEIEGELDVSKATSSSNMINMFGASYNRNDKLTKVLFKGFINYNISFTPCPSLSYESVKSILTACSNTTNTGSKTIYFTRTLTDQNGELANLIATCNTKGWTISGLTLE